MSRDGAVALAFGIAALLLFALWVKLMRVGARAADGNLAHLDDPIDEHVASLPVAVEDWRTRHPAARGLLHEDFGWCACRRCAQWDLELAAILEGGGA